MPLEFYFSSSTDSYPLLFCDHKPKILLFFLRGYWIVDFHCTTEGSLLTYMRGKPYHWRGPMDNHVLCLRLIKILTGSVVWLTIDSGWVQGCSNWQMRNWVYGKSKDMTKVTQQQLTKLRIKPRCVYLTHNFHKPCLIEQRTLRLGHLLKNPEQKYRLTAWFTTICSFSELINYYARH